MRIKMKRFLGILLSLALVLSLFPSESLTAYADNTETLLTTITATGIEQASYSTANVATVSFSYTAGGSSAYLANWGWWGYGWTATVNAAEGYTITKCIFYDDANRDATDSSSPFVVETTEGDKTPRINGLPIDGGNNQSKGLKKIEVYGYAAPETPSGYTITIPSTLAVANSGWNATDGISATGSLASGKKLTVTASSENSFKLKSGNNEVGYNLATATGTYSSSATPASWEFTAAEVAASGGTNKGMGIIVEDYSTKPAGTYQDTVTFTAAVEDAVTAPTLAGVTLSDGMIIEPHCTVGGGDNWVQFKYVADDNKFVPNFNSYNDVYSKSYGRIMQQLADQWAYSTFEYHETPNGNFYLTQTGNTVHLRADDGINMNVIDLQLDFDNMTYTQLYKEWYRTVSGSFSSIKIGDTTITASQMTAQ